MSLARACGLNALVVSSTSLVSKVVGESEKRLCGLFAQARHSAPALLIFDQIEAIAPVRVSLFGRGSQQRGRKAKQTNTATGEEDVEEAEAEAEAEMDDVEDEEDDEGPHALERMLSVLLIEMDGVMSKDSNQPGMCIIICIHQQLCIDCSF